MSKRKQSLSACLVCFECKIAFNSGKKILDERVDEKRIIRDSVADPGC
jgi:hypothetical protein